MKNDLAKLMINEMLVTDEKEIAEHIVNHFSNQFKETMHKY